MMILVLKFHGLRHKSLIFITMVIAVAMAMTNKACFSFPLVSHLSKKSIATKKSTIRHRPFVACYTSSTKLFSSPAPSSDGTNTSTAARSPTFSTPKREISQEESKKNKELMGASKLQLAPMMEYTDRHFRHLIRLISGKTLLYTEMVAGNALAFERSACMEEYERTATEGSSTSSPPSAQEIRDNYPDQYLQRFLNQGRVQPLEGPSVLQLGGSDPATLYEATQTVMDMVRLLYK
jgi:hypothetical protein